jgi:hypothetical protein
MQIVTNNANPTVIKVLQNITAIVCLRLLGTKYVTKPSSKSLKENAVSHPSAEMIIGTSNFTTDIVISCSSGKTTGGRTGKTDIFNFFFFFFSFFFVYNVKDYYFFLFFSFLLEFLRCWRFATEFTYGLNFPRQETIVSLKKKEIQKQKNDD